MGRPATDYKHSTMHLMPLAHGLTTTKWCVCVGVSVCRCVCVCLHCILSVPMK